MRWMLLCLLVIAPALPGRAQDSILKQAAFCRSLAENQAPGEKTESFLPEDAIYLSVELKGRPKSGVLGCRFLMETTLIGEAKVDLADAGTSTGKGALAAVGQNTFAGFHLSPRNPLPVGSMYRAEVTLDGRALGTFPFQVSPPKGAIESKLKSASFEKEIAGKRQPLEPEAALAPEDSVLFKGVADLGVGSWMRITWLVAGKPDPKGVSSHTMEENKPDCGFSFAFRPDKGWPAGRHEVSLVINGREATRQAFTVTNVLPPRTAPQAAPIQIAGFALLRGDEKGGETMTEVPAFSTADTVLHAEWTLKTPVNGAGVQYKWVQVDAGEVKETMIGKADLPEGLYRKLRTSLKLHGPPPAGRYRVELLQHGKVVEGREFEVKP